MSFASPEAKPTLNVKSPDTYLTPAFTTSAVYSFVPLSPEPATSPSAKPTATVRSPVTALIPACKPALSLTTAAFNLEPSTAE